MKVIFFIMLLVSFDVYANENCTSDTFHSAKFENIYLGSVVANKGGKVHARKNTDKCNQKDHCFKKGYLINNDKVLIFGNDRENWQCIYYRGNKSEYIGWLNVKNVKLTPVKKSPNINDWTGKWYSFHKIEPNKIAISLKIKQALYIIGEAFWFGGKAFDGYDDVHTGNIEGIGKPIANKMTIIEDECQLKLKLLPPYLIANDNGNCGGVNVRFNDIYKRITSE